MHSLAERQGSGSPAFYRPELDGLRFFAFLCVFAFHRMDYVPTDPVRDRWLYRIGNIGPFGVPVFFLLSAFLITELLRRERERTGKLHVKAFYVRRILRIWPLYFAAFFGLAILDRFIPGVGSRDPLAWLAFTFFAGNWYILHHGWIAGAVDPLWSISVEEQFYIAVPLLAALGGRKAIAFVCGALFAAAYVTILVYAVHPVAGDNGEWTNGFVQYQFFVAGTVLSLILKGRVVAIPLALRPVAFALGLFCWFTALLACKVQSWEPHPTPVGALCGWLLVLTGSVLLFLSFFGTPARLIPRGLAYLGRISYGLYVVHSLVFFLVFEKMIPALRRAFPGARMPASMRDIFWTAFVLALSIAAASLSYHFFEKPFLRLKQRFSFVAARDELTAAG